MGNRTIVPLIFIMMVLMVVSVCNSAGSVPGMDTDLGDSNASFWGEFSDDGAGFSVAGAGDVNGDGYDDILIGARNNDDGGSNAGQTYVIFGNKSSWTMDTDLSNADASFWGEDMGDNSGWSIAGAGDVNGDGYDDILIGAWYNDDGGSIAGQTYLVLGKASGWSMDTDLSNADASFWGEDAGDQSGWTVAGAGDVNGDGYDDILIGAWRNDDGGSDAGQTYLILGMASGWSMDTDLSNADASFIGEDAGDYSGCSVAGAGDVNGDGYDDILIGAWGDDDGGGFAGQTYLVLGKASGWSMDTNLSKADASFWGEDALDWAGCTVAGAGDVNGDEYADILIGATGDDDGGVNAGQTYLILGKASGWSMDANLSTANASFWGEDTEDRSGGSVAGAGDVNGDGYDDILIGAYGNDDGGSDAGQTYLILGKASGWSMDVDLSNTDASFWGEKSVDWAGRSVAGAGDVNGDGVDDILIGAFYSDEAGIDAGQTYLVFYDDGVPPKIEMDMTPANATTGDGFTFNVSVSDNTGIYNVSIEHWYGDSQSHHNVSANRSTGNQTDCTWLVNITIPFRSTETLHYIVHVRDIVERLTSSIQKDVVVIDNDLPTFGVDASPGTAETDMSYTFNVSVEDNIGVDAVWVEYWYGNGTRTNASMDPEGTTWEHWMIVADTLEDLHFVIWSNDTSGNVNSTLERTVDVIDINGPHIINEGTKNWATTGDPFEFTLTAHDNVGLKRATLWYALDDGELTPVPMEVIEAYPNSGNTLYSLWIDVPSDQSDNITYSYEIEDLYGNVFRTHVDIVRVRDNDDPTIVEDRTPGEALMGEDLTFVVEVSDNTGILTVEVEYAMGDGDPVTAEMVAEGSEGVYTLTIGIAVDELEPITYRFSVMDLGWNVANGTQVLVPVVDAISPEILDVSWGLALKGTDVTVVLQATDNVGIALASIDYRFGDGPKTILEMDGNMEAIIPVPRNVDGDLRLVFTVQDAAGNEAVSEEMLVPLLNAKPTVDPVPVWEVTEEEDSSLDLAPYISDANDDPSSLTLSCSDGTVTVDGLVLRALYVLPFLDRTIDLTVSDGEDDVDFQVTIHIVDVNDAPVIISVSPEDGSKYKQGKTVTFTVEVTDEDGDDLTMTWTSDGVTIGTGDTLEYKKLKPGTRTIKVTVSDGEASVEDEFTVVITKEEESPALGGVFALLAMLVGMAAIMMKQKD